MNWVRTGSRNGLSPVRCQTITWSNSDLQSIGPSGTNFNEIRIKIQKCSFMQNAFENTVCDLAAICPGYELTYKNPQYLSTIIIIKACHPGVNYWDYYPAALSFNSFIWRLAAMMKSTGARSANDLQGLDCMAACQAISFISGHQGPVSLRLMTSQFKDIVIHTQK